MKYINRITDKDKIKESCVYNRRTTLKALTSGGIGIAFLSSPVSASNRKTDSCDKKSESSHVEEKLDDEVLEEIDDIEEFEKRLDDDVVFKADKEKNTLSLYSKERTITLPIDNNYITIELTLADGPSYIDVYVLGVLTIKGNLPNGSFDYRKLCGDAGAAHGCIEMEFDRANNIFEYEVDIDYWLGSWNTVYKEETVDLEEECDCNL